jgi:molybdopterin-guanine dinucleotide biosynthesis protein MobB
MIPVFGIVGRSNSGKTTLVVRLVEELVRRGYKVGTIKHCPHGFELNRPDSDTARHFAAGAQTVAMASGDSWALVSRTNVSPTLADLLQAMPRQTLDLVLVEGFKTEPEIKKIEVAVNPPAEDLVCASGGGNFVAVVTENAPVPPDIPLYHPDDIVGLAELIIKTLIQ